MTNTDIYFSIGSTHQVCQDFAIADNTYAIISDGCSSAKDADWGARLLAKSCQIVLKQKSIIDFDTLRDVLNRACNYVNALELDQECLAATLLCAYVSNHVINAFIVGDGYIVARNRNGKLTVISHLFETGAPYYLYYNINDSLKKGYFTHYGNGNLLIEKIIYDKDKIVHRDESSYNAADFNTYTFPLEEYDVVAVISDGLKSFTKQVKGVTSISNQPVAVESIVKDIFQFKQVAGQFVHRRCQRVFKEYNLENIKHHDDFSIGVVHHES